MGTGASIASISQGKNKTCALFSHKALIKPPHHNELTLKKKKLGITKLSYSWQRDAITSKLAEPRCEYKLAAAHKKAKSPSCEIAKTFNAAFIVCTRIDQKSIKKNEVMLIHSQKKTKVITSNEQKKIKANCENSDESRTIETPLTSNSKYSAKKTKHKIKANNKMLLKWQLNSSQDKVSEAKYSCD
jgi:hypothetical protein